MDLGTSMALNVEILPALAEEDDRAVDPTVAQLIAVQEAQGINQTEMARRCGWTKQYLNKIQKGGIKNPGISAVRTMARALGLELAFVVRR